MEVFRILLHLIVHCSKPSASDQLREVSLDCQRANILTFVNVKLFENALAVTMNCLLLDRRFYITIDIKSK